MKYVRIDPTGPGNEIDPDPYLAALPTFVENLPDGARSFAAEPGHYDFFGKRCVKNLKLLRIRFEDQDGELGLTVDLRHNCHTHEELIPFDLVAKQAELRSR
jgi:hypothetical protein